MAVKPIITVPNPLLYQKCEKVQKVNTEVKTIIQDMIDTLMSAKNPEGAGLAAPQIGILKRIIVVRRFFPDPNDNEKTLSKEYVFINPKIISSSETTDLHYEGCLSVPNTYGQVYRPLTIKFRYLNEQAEEEQKKASGFFARVIQHEIDHLDGIIFTTKVTGNTITEQELDKIQDAEGTSHLA